MAQKQQARHRGLYNLRCRGATLSVGDLVLVKQTAWKGRHKIQDRWEDREYQVVDQPTPGIPVYTVKSLGGGQTKVLHRNLLLPLQGRLRQEGETVAEVVTDSEEEEEGRAVTPCVTRAPKGGPRNISKPQDDLTPVESEASSVADPSFILWMEAVMRRMPMIPYPLTLLLVVLLLLIPNQQKPSPLSLIA